MFEDLLLAIRDWFYAVEGETITGFIILLSLSTTVHIFIRVWVIRLLHKLDEKTSSEWYAEIIKARLPQRALMMVPLIFLYLGVDFVPGLNEAFEGFVMRFTAALMILVTARVIDALLTSVHAIYRMLPKSDLRPIKSYIQLGKLIVYIFALIFIIASLSDQSPWYFLSGIGAIMAILLLIFRDTLLSLVASVQLTNNDLIRIGDWIEMPNFGADGDVVDISLNTVRVQNFDKTITVIPTHKFLDHSFRNWRGMSEAGGRRIMRALHIDLTSVRFLNYKEIQELRKSHLLKAYIDGKMEQIMAYNETHLGDHPAVLTNARWLTNLGTFRAYVIEYLKRHPRSKKELLMLVRQLEPTDRGLPLQVYVFTNTTVWAEYEAIQADIFDHLLAVLPEFGLRVYQQPSGADFRSLDRKTDQRPRY
ncbi:miniconductance mechanosensitive channel [Cyclonatronum proteinivorum]|uniref:Miniconductance mechanosensitive channel n=1 Tax=Cyclonatronum proteinivorum TaxID=1457365 RepID=A0A345UN49_9BACT|nr:mechanosensitive ion channel domain-containing protein [Cyclonatronum proteinivorum]AXJ01901.1 miniconductance mechanosensitive channel [Cyclonatronum proteinivorum]